MLTREAEKKKGLTSEHRRSRTYSRKALEGVLKSRSSKRFEADQATQMVRVVEEPRTLNIKIGSLPGKKRGNAVSGSGTPSTDKKEPLRPLRNKPPSTFERRPLAGVIRKAR